MVLFKSHFFPSFLDGTLFCQSKTVAARATRTSQSTFPPFSGTRVRRRHLGPCAGNAQEAAQTRRYGNDVKRLFAETRKREKLSGHPLVSPCVRSSPFKLLSPQFLTSLQSSTTRSFDFFHAA